MTVRIRRTLPALLASLLAALLVAVLLVVVDSPAGASPPAGAFAANSDYCMGQCNDILPSGENGSATLAQILAFKATGVRPANTDDQLAPYANLVDGYTGLNNDTLGSYFNDASFGVPKDQVMSTEKPRSDVTIVRDKQDVPHITGTTRSGTEFGAGYAAGQDRLFLMDVFRHLGEGQLSSFAGGAAANRSLEQQIWALAPYTKADLQAQVTALAASGPRGAQAVQDMTNYVAGLNDYIATAKSDLNFPGEYDLTGNANILTGNGIQNFTVTDLVAIGAVIGAIFGSGGGNQVASALVKQAAEAKYGTIQGDKVWASFREENDPEAETTITSGQSFPYAQSPTNPVGVAMPDAGSVTAQQEIYDPTGSAAPAATAAAAKKTPAPTARSTVSAANAKTNPKISKLKGSSNAGVLPAGLLTQKHSMSNALLVSGKETDTGNPIAVFGPQTGYYAPQLLMLEELQGPGISARGAAFAGLNFYVQLGRGQDYAWSATSAGQDIVDTFAVTLCNTDGTPATTASMSYEYHGQCLPMTPIEVDDSWGPTIADSTAAGSYKLITYRTNYGLVEDRATVGGKPVAYTILRSTYGHEIDTIVGFQEFNDPSFVTSPQTFQKAASAVSYTFNWFYVDNKHIAYYNSGVNPVRAANTDPNLPIAAQPQYEWQGWNPSTYTEQDTAFAAHPNSIDQDYYVSWNNKQAPGYTSAEYGDGSVFRSNMLVSRVKKLIASGTKITRASLTQAMEDAAVTDLRGEDVLPDLLKVIESQPVADPAEQAAITKLQQWQTDGTKIKETSAGSQTFTDAKAIQIMDAWWPLLVQGEFEPDMGTPLFDAMIAVLPANESPSGGQNIPGATGSLTNQPHKGSSFEYGWWTYVDKDLRSVLGEPVQGALGEKYCGGGDLAQCRATLLSTLTQAAAEPAATVYPADSYCDAGDQWCADSIVQSPFGGITDPITNWQNRPTYQQVVQFPAHRGDNISNLALGKTVTATSYASSGLLGLGSGYLPSYAVDGDTSTEWASSGSSSNQSITVDLGSTQRVGRAILNWDSDYGQAYKIEVSADGENFTTVWSTTTGTGGTDNDAFTPVNARYVRMQGVTSGTADGYDLTEFGIYAQ